MCGICGFTYSNKNNIQTIIQDMTDIISHRGPDGQGHWKDEHIVLGHRRLSLIDLSGGCQPMVRQDREYQSQLYLPCSEEYETVDKTICKEHTWIDNTGRFAIVYNGEIYNYKELKKELEKIGWSFSTNSDTEVLLIGYLQYKEKILDMLRGMFAFAIWDSEEELLFVARDRFGIKPFYYTITDNNEIIFASEIKSILQHPAYHKEVNEEALIQYLCYQFSVLDESFFKGIYKLPAASYGIFSRKDKDKGLAIHRWWYPLFNQDNQINTLEEAIDKTNIVMHDSVKYHNVADVEVGSFLSSGIDSSYLAALLKKNNENMQTFTVGFAEYEGERNEISWADELAEKLHMKHYSHYITKEEYWNNVDNVIWHMEEPLGDPSAFALWFVDELASQHVKAVLSGEGADELFGGYPIYQAILENKKLRHIPHSLLNIGSKALQKLHMRGANYLQRASESVDEWYYTNAINAAFDVEQRDMTLSTKVKQNYSVLNTGTVYRYPVKKYLDNPLFKNEYAPPQSVSKPIYDECKTYDEITQMQYVDILLWMTGDILLKTDKMSMAHSLESRVPYLDKEVFKIASMIPTDFRMTSEQTKIPLRKASECVLPTQWVEKKKLGFPVPLKEWLRTDDVIPMIEERFHSKCACKYFDIDELNKLLENHIKGFEDNSRKIWIIYTFLIWYKIYFEKNSEIENTNLKEEML